MSAGKLQEITSFARDLMDMGGAVMDQAVAPTRAAFQEALLYAPGARIAGGTDEILKNILAQRVLGLPADVRVDKDVPFDDLHHRPALRERRRPGAWSHRPSRGGGEERALLGEVVVGHLRMVADRLGTRLVRNVLLNTCHACHLVRTGRGC